MAHAARTVSPYGMTPQEWTAATTMDLEAFGNIPVLLDPSKWQDWGASVLALSTLNNVVLPDPYSFDDWQEWALNFNAVLNGRQ